MAKEKDHGDYIKDAQSLLRTFRGKVALHVIQDGLEKFPSDPLLLSFNGYLTACVEKKFDKGINVCEDAISSFNGPSRDRGTMYLNLGKAYVAAKKKADAMVAFKNGIVAEPGNRDLQWEMKKLGTRRKPVVPFLKRSNPINKFIGLLLYKLSRR